MALPALYEGICLASLAYAFWGFAPLFWKTLDHVPPYELWGHRILWSFVFLLPFVLKKQLRDEMKATLKSKALPYLICSACLIGLNWFLYVYAIVTNQVLEASLGYFLTPIFTVIVGIILLKEKLNLNQLISVFIAMTGVLSLFLLQSEHTPLISIVLAVSFAFYGYFKVKAMTSGLLSVFLEVLLLSPFVFLFLCWKGSIYDPKTTCLLMISGPVTAIPLIWYAMAIHKADYSTIGFLQYISPIIKIVLALFLFNEPFTLGYQICFPLIWISLSIFSWDLYKTRLFS